MGMIIVPTGLVGGAATYATWDQVSESSFGEPVSFVVMSEGTGAGDDETGKGVLTGVNLVLTDVNNVPGVVAGYRQLTRASSQYFTLTQTWADEWFTGATWSVIQKWSDWTAVNLAHGLFSMENAGGTERIVTIGTDVNKLFAFVANAGAGGARLNATTTNTYPTSGAVYTFIGTVGTSTYAGFTQSGSGTAGQPTKWADFAANDRVSNALAGGAFSAGDFDTYREVGTYEGAGHSCTAKFGWMIVSKKFLITV